MQLCQRSTWMAATLAIASLLGTGSASADIVVGGSFSPTGDVGFVNSPPGLSIGFGNGNGLGVAGNGSVFQLDGFIAADGQNWSNNGSGSGTSAQLSFGIPSGIGFAFNSFSTAHTLMLDYTFVNNTGADLSNFQFMLYVDPDIGDDTTNEWVAPTGTLAATAFDPSTFQVGDPSLSSIFTNLMAGTLNNANDFPDSSTLGDVSLALGFSKANFASGSVFEVRILLADDGQSIGSFSLTQNDPDFPDDSLTISGISAVPEPSSLVLVSIGLVATVLVRRRSRA